MLSTQTKRIEGQLTEASKADPLSDHIFCHQHITIIHRCIELVRKGDRRWIIEWNAGFVLLEGDACITYGAQEFSLLVPLNGEECAFILQSVRCAILSLLDQRFDLQRCLAVQNPFNFGIKSKSNRVTRLESSSISPENATAAHVSSPTIRRDFAAFPDPSHLRRSENPARILCFEHHEELTREATQRLMISHRSVFASRCGGEMNVERIDQVDCRSSKRCFRCECSSGNSSGRYS